MPISTLTTRTQGQRLHTMSTVTNNTITKLTIITRQRSGMELDHVKSMRRLSNYSQITNQHSTHNSRSQLSKLQTNHQNLHLTSHKTTHNMLNTNHGRTSTLIRRLLRTSSTTTNRPHMQRHRHTNRILLRGHMQMRLLQINLSIQLSRHTLHNRSQPRILPIRITNRHPMINRMTLTRFQRQRRATRRQLINLNRITNRHPTHLNRNLINITLRRIRTPISQVTMNSRITTLISMTIIINRRILRHSQPNQQVSHGTLISRQPYNRQLITRHINRHSRQHRQTHRATINISLMSHMTKKIQTIMHRTKSIQLIQTQSTRTINITRMIPSRPLIKLLRISMSTPILTVRNRRHIIHTQVQSRTHSMIIMNSLTRRNKITRTIIRISQIMTRRLLIQISRIRISLRQRLLQTNQRHNMQNITTSTRTSIQMTNTISNRYHRSINTQHMILSRRLRPINVVRLSLGNTRHNQIMRILHQHRQRNKRNGRRTNGNTTDNISKRR